MTNAREKGRALTGSPIPEVYTALRRSRKQKLSADDVRAIRKRLAKGDTHQSIANDYGVGVSTVGNISRGVTFKWLDKEPLTLI